MFKYAGICMHTNMKARGKALVSFLMAVSLVLSLIGLEITHQAKLAASEP